MNYAKLLSKSSVIVLSAAVCATLAATDASAQRRGGGGGRSPGGGRSVGSAAPRGSVRGGGVRGVSPRVVVGAPYRSYYGRPYYRPGISVGFYAGYPFYGYGYYGYPYRYYGAPYGYYGYPYGYGYPAGYGYGYGYGYGNAYGGIRIQGAPPDAEVFADGYYVGIVDDFDGTYQHVNLEAGRHQIEIRFPGGNAEPLTFDVNVQAGQTITYHAGITQ